MSHRAKREYLAAIWSRYQRVGRRFKTKILDEFCANCRYCRKYAIRLLKRPLHSRRRRPGPTVRYGPEVLSVLRALWKLSEWMGSKRLKAALPLWLPYYERHQGAVPEAPRRLLLKMSPATIDRLLRPARRHSGRRGPNGTWPARNLKFQVAIRRGTHRSQLPGLLEMDTVAHSGEALTGNFVWTLTATDLCTQWTENRAVWNKGATEVLRQIQDMERHLPFTLWGIDVDSGSEFLNYHLFGYCSEHQPPLVFTRSRPAYKNDQAHVEQRNSTHVRQLLGYVRIDNPGVLPSLNELYHLWNAWHNFFFPTLKLKSKRRVGFKVQRRYCAPKTPYQRLQRNPHLSQEQRTSLEKQFAQLDPILLKHEIEVKLKYIFQNRSV